MKKQYTVSEATTFRYWVCTYHDGVLIQRDKVWVDDLSDFTDKLEADGYEQANTKRTVQKAKAEYEYVAARQLVGENKMENNNDEKTAM